MYVYLGFDFFSVKNRVYSIEIQFSKGTIFLSNAITLDAKKTALVVIDLQKGILSQNVEPYDAQAVLTNTVTLAQAFRAKGGFVVLVTVGSRDGKDMLRPITDQPLSAMPERPRNWAELAPELGPETTDHTIIKHQWGAFFGTDLDLQLRRRGIDTIVLCGISTSIGVETTAREAYQYGYQQVFVEDAMAAMDAKEHEHTVRHIFSRLGRIRVTKDLIID